MKIYWSIYSTPELAGLPKEKRQEVWQECRGKAFRHWQTWSLILISLLFTFVVVILAQTYLGSSGLMPALILIGLGGAVIGHFIQNIIRSDIKEYLNSNVKTK